MHSGGIAFGIKLCKDSVMEFEKGNIRPPDGECGKDTVRSAAVILLIVAALVLGWKMVTMQPAILYQVAPGEEPKTLWQLMWEQ